MTLLFLSNFIALAATLPLLVRGAPSDGPSAASAIDYTLSLEPRRIAPDGFERTSAVIVRKNPGTPTNPPDPPVIPGPIGPLIRAKKGDTIRVNVINNMNSNELWHSSSIHWHGLHMMNRNYDDGAASVNQCPTPPNAAYEYTLLTREQYGTFWYHSHFSTQYCDGIRGPLVVYHPDDPYKSMYDVDDASTIISLTEWYDIPAIKAFHPISPGHFPLPPVPNATLINGLGIQHGTGGKSGQLAVINVQQGKKYRMRLINMACEPDYKFSIANHTLKIIEADSLLVEPLEVDGLTILAGQRYSFVLNANQPVDNYWIRTKPHSIGVDDTFVDDINSAILRYNGAPNARPRQPYSNFTNPLLESKLRPYIGNKVAVPGVRAIGKADISLKLSVDVDANFPGGPNPNGTNTWWLVDHGPDGNTTRKYLPPSRVPVLLQILSGARENSDFAPRDAVYTLPPNKVIELVFEGHDEPLGPHPFHLHGHDFWVVQSADGDAPNWDNAIRRDTVSGGDDSKKITVIRFVTDNPGPWFMHCHIDWHLDAGLGIVFAEDPKTAAKDPAKKPTKEWYDMCTAYNDYLDAGGPE